ncbi:hypothetical protein BGZ94_008718 [Podila epigama]|nr:hypothetical protein BGZ94_008718 [Podila epigama]
MATALSPVLECSEFVAAEGRYELLKDMHLDQVLPHPVIPTHVSTVSVKYKNYHTGIRPTHGKQTSADSTLTASNISRLDEHLREVRLANEQDDASKDTLPRNFHGNLVDLPIYNDDSNAIYKNSIGVMSPGPPPLKDSSAEASGRLSDPYAQFGAPPTQHQHQTSSLSHKSPSRASSFRHQSTSQNQDDTGSSQSSSAAASTTSFSSFFGGKRKKPKNNIAKTNSTFVSKITTHENLAKIIANRVNEDVYLFWNTGRTFTWSDVGQKPNEPLSHITFTKAFPTSHDVNILTRSCDHLDVIIGFNTGDIIWFDPLSNKYYRLNKQGVIKDSPVTVVKWMPGSETQFMAAFQDGSILIMDKERDDNTFTVPNTPSDNGVIDVHNERLLDTFQSYFGALTCVCWSPDGKYILTGGQDDLVTIWSFKDQRIVARCQGHQSYITGVAFDPWRCDERNYRFGSVGEDAKLLLWDFSVGALHKPKARRGSTATVLGNSMAPGGSTGKAYKPGHASKGSIASLRGIGGHSLFSGHTNKSQASAAHSLTSAANQLPKHLDESSSRTEDTSSNISQRRGSIGGTSSASSMAHPNSVGDMAFEYNNGQASRHDLDVASLAAASSRPSLISQDSSMTVTGSMSGQGSESGPLRPSYKKSDRARTLPHLHLQKSNGNGDGSSNGFASLFKSPNKTQAVNGTTTSYVRPAEPRSNVAMLQPMMAKSIHAEPLSSITFREDAILTSDRRGHIKVWKRPAAQNSVHSLKA